MKARLLWAAFLAAGLGRGAWADHKPHDHPDVAVRIDQALLETEAVLEAQRRAHGGKVRDFRLEIKEDGFHASGKYRIPVLPDVSFEAVISLVWTKPNEFEIRSRKLTVLGFINVTSQVMEGVESGLKEALPGALSFHRLGERPDGSQVLRVAVDMKALLPSLPTLFLSGITTRDKVLILKAQLS